MCDRCANIDYPIGDSIWLPCGGPASRYQYKRPDWHEGNNDEVTANLISQIRRAYEKNALLEEQQVHQDAKDAEFHSIT